MLPTRGNTIAVVSSFLDPEALASATGRLWTRVDVVASTASTNADLVDAARADAPGGRVLVTSDQQAGRGRFERVWECPPDRAVALSALVRPRRPMAEWGWLSLLVGIAVVDGLQAAAGVDVGLKWPNDVLVGEKKICGILCEAVPSESGPAAVLGLGVNIALTRQELPVPTATSLRLEGSDASATDVVLAILAALQDHFLRWDAGGSLATDYSRRCSTVGQQVAVHVAENVTTIGRALGVDDAGCLIVQTGQGVRSFAAGDVVHLRKR